MSVILVSTVILKKDYLARTAGVLALMVGAGVFFNPDEEELG